MGRVLLAMTLGLFAFVVFLGVGELLQVPGQNTIREIVGAGLAGALYLAVSQFFVAPRGSRRLGPKWRTMVAMGAPLLAMCLLANVLEGGRAWLYSALPMFIPGCLGIVAGAWAAGRVEMPAASPASSRRLLFVCAALMAGVAAAVAVGLIPLTAADTDPRATPQNFVPVAWVSVVLDVLVAAALAAIAVRVGRGARPSLVGLGFLAFLAFLLAFSGVPTVVLFTHGPAMRVAAILGVACSAVGFVVTALIADTALRLSAGQAG
jgi:hypothetical protein